MKRWIVFTILAIACACSYAEQLPLSEGIVRFKANEDRINTFVNAYGNYTTSGSVAVKTLPQYMSDMTTAGLRYETLVLLEADTSQANGAHALVYGDSTPANNGYYMWTTGSPGSWDYLGWFPTTAMELPNTTHADPSGVIYKDGDRFLHDFNWGTGGDTTTVGQNTFLGVNSGNFTMGEYAIVPLEASDNTGVGYQTLTHLTTGSTNTGIGVEALHSITSGTNNTALGGFAGLGITTGSGNVAIGKSALGAATTGSSSIGIGYENLYSNTGSESTSVGSYAMRANTSGSRNSSFGFKSLYSNSTGNDNNAFGYHAQYSTTGNYNTSLGSYSLYSNTSGSNNIGIGLNSVYSNTTGSYNIGIGGSTLHALTSGSNNVALGYNAGRYVDHVDPNATSNTSIFLGEETCPYASGQENQIVIGYYATGNGSNSITLGSDSITKTILRANVGVGNTAPGYPLEVTGTTSTDGIIYAIASKSAAYTATAADYTILVSDDTTITLPASASNTGRVYVVKKVDTAGTTTIIDANSTETIDGDETVSLTTQYSFRMIQCTGTGWTIIGRY